MNWSRLAALVLLTGAAPLIVAAQAARPASPGARMDYGRFLSYSVSKSPKVIDGPDVVTKGIAIRVGKDSEAAVLFDTDTMRFAAGWTGPFLDLSKTHLVQDKGSACAFIAGQIQWETKPGPGWSHNGRFDDPRQGGYGGPLPRDHARYRGLHVHGDRVVLSYEVNGVSILESPWAVTENGNVIFLRTVHVEAHPSEMEMLIAASGTKASISTDKPGVQLVEHDGLLTVKLAPHQSNTTFTVAIGTAAPRQAQDDPKLLIGTGQPRWPRVLQTKGLRAKDDSAYVVDTLTLPFDNPWSSWMRITAFDFFADGKRAALSTWNGDVWIVSNIDDSLANLKWKRFASGLFEGLGLKIVNDQIYIQERSQLTRLHDLNNDGEADFYENINNDAPVHPTYHDFAYELQTDPQGNFYCIRTGHRVPSDWPYHGCVLKISKDGSKTEVFAGGLRAANGLCVGPAGQITCADNQGNYIPTSRINWVKPGGFYGYLPHSHRPGGPPPQNPDPPLCYIPYHLDNSSGSQLWITGGKFGPLNDKLLHTSYGKSSLLAVFPQDVAGAMQAAITPLNLKFDSGIMRARMNPADGQVYVAGLKGWQTNGGKDGALHRIRYTHRKTTWPTDCRVEKTGLRLSFDLPLAEKSATDPDNYSVERWQYKWSEAYGSPELSIADPAKKGRDPVEVKSIHLSPDRKSALLLIDDLKPVPQMAVQWNLDAQDGQPIKGEAYFTINAVPK